MESTVYEEYYISEWMPKKGFNIEQASCGINMVVLPRRWRDLEMKSAEHHSLSSGLFEPHVQISPMITISLMMLSIIIEKELQSVIQPLANLPQQVDSSKDEVWSRFMSMDEYLTSYSIQRSIMHNHHELLKEIDELSATARVE
ncbi:hypothetical protein BCON_0265g00040 [Botryotinia convoluta]|uniref:Uncharacterized protein n=1 Tax=Botryotinia convoluta TaxID=54673 RepID=A0A4Z1HH29_9HELO|nr:hypothetical protein BCON_0265g00040 [Botryotinia convoluta]